MASILCVDDDALILAAMVRLLDDLGHEVVTTDSGQRALQLGASRHFDLVLVDFDLQQAVDGLAVLRALRELQPSCMRVLVTGGRDASMFVNAINLGEIARVLPKPFRRDDLRQVIEEVLELGHHQGKAALARAAQAAAHRQVAECLRDGLLRLAVQPIVDLASGQVVAAEGLLRPQHPVLSDPLRLLEAAELSGHLLEVGEQVFHLAARWLGGADDLRLFVNLHAAQLADPRLLTRLAPLLPYAGRVMLEITERSDLQLIAGWDHLLEQLIGAGFQFAVDDLGAGYSNLALLSDLRPAFIKVDMSIVRNIHQHARKQRLFEMLVGFANATGTRLVAEGVESAHEADALASLGAHLAQGYYFGRPSLNA